MIPAGRGTRDRETVMSYQQYKRARQRQERNAAYSRRYQAEKGAAAESRERVRRQKDGGPLAYYGGILLALVVVVLMMLWLFGTIGHPGVLGR